MKARADGPESRRAESRRAESRLAEPRRAREQNRILAGVLALLFVQLGLFTAAWEGALGREYGRALPFFLVSAACFAANLVLLKRLRALDVEGND